jgi:hypothetical protein
MASIRPFTRIKWPAFANITGLSRKNIKFPSRSEPQHRLMANLLANKSSPNTGLVLSRRSWPGEYSATTMTGRIFHWWYLNPHSVKSELIWSNSVRNNTRHSICFSFLRKTEWKRWVSLSYLEFLIDRYVQWRARKTYVFCRIWPDGLRYCSSRAQAGDTVTHKIINSIPCSLLFNDPDAHRLMYSSWSSLVVAPVFFHWY